MLEKLGFTSGQVLINIYTMNFSSQLYGQEDPSHTVSILLFLVKQNNLTHPCAQITSCFSAPYTHLHTHTNSIELHAMYTWVMDSIYVYMLYRFILCVYMCIYSLNLFYIHKGWISYKLHKGSWLGEGRSASVLSLWKILCFALPLFMTFHSQHVLKLKALLNTIDTFICLYS